MQDRIKEIRYRAEKATPAPWDIGDGGELSLYGGENSVVKKGGRVIVSRAIYGSDFDKQTYIDVDFIANSPADINYLLAALEEAQDTNEKLKKDFNKEAESYIKKIWELESRERVLREALEFHAIKDNYQEQLVSNEDDGWDIYRKPTIVLDNGKIAREALGQEGK
jgi:hypothetical protein